MPFNNQIAPILEISNEILLLYKYGQHTPTLQLSGREKEYVFIPWV